MRLNTTPRLYKCVQMKHFGIFTYKFKANRMQIEYIVVFKLYSLYNLQVMILEKKRFVTDMNLQTGLSLE